MLNGGGTEQARVYIYDDRRALVEVERDIASSMMRQGYTKVVFVRLRQIYKFYLTSVLYYSVTNKRGGTAGGDDVIIT